MTILTKTAWVKGDKIQVTRKKIGGGTEKIQVTFLSHISGENRFWAELDGRKFRAGLATAESTSPQFKKDEPGKPAKEKGKKAAPKFEPDVTKTAAEAIAKITSDKPVKTEAKVKAQPKAKKPQIDATNKEAKPPTKTQRVIALLATGEPLKDISKMVGCDSSLVYDFSKFFTFLDDGQTAKAISEKYKFISEKSLASKYELFNSLKRGQ